MSTTRDATRNDLRESLRQAMNTLLNQPLADAFDLGLQAKHVQAND